MIEGPAQSCDLIFITAENNVMHCEMEVVTLWLCLAVCVTFKFLMSTDIISTFSKKTV